MGICGIERLDSLDVEWLALMLCAATDASPVGACGIEHLDGEWLVLIWCAATDLRLQWALVESSV